MRASVENCFDFVRYYEAKDYSQDLFFAKKFGYEVSRKPVTFDVFKFREGDVVEVIDPMLMIKHYPSGLGSLEDFKDWVVGNDYATAGSAVVSVGRKYVIAKVKYPETEHEIRWNPEGIPSIYVYIDQPDELEKLDAVINKVVPSGFNIRENLDELHPTVPNTIKHMLESMTFKGATEEPFIERVTLSLGTLGGGNHFIELSKDDENNYYLLVHTGSRSLGLKVAQYHQKKADLYHERDDKGLATMIETLKQEGRQSEIQEAIKNFKAVNVKPQLPYLEGSAVDDYLNDMQLAQRYAYMNRKTIIDKIVSNMGWTVVDSFDSIHNYIDVASNTIRKGATDAQEGVRLVIPLNMKEGSIIGVGKGNTDWNNSAPHGAGRVLSRSKAKELLDLDEFKQTMSGIYTTSVVQSTLDEAPKAYKNADEIKEIIKDTVDIQKIVKPVYNFKAK